MIHDKFWWRFYRNILVALNHHIRLGFHKCYNGAAPMIILTVIASHTYILYSIMINVIYHIMTIQSRNHEFSLDLLNSCFALAWDHRIKKSLHCMATSRVDANNVNNCRCSLQDQDNTLSLRIKTSWLEWAHMQKFFTMRICLDSHRFVCWFLFCFAIIVITLKRFVTSDG
jgi:hypothetical protein